MMVPAFPPREMLEEEYLHPLNMSMADLAKVISPCPAAAKQLLGDDIYITAELALCLARAFDTSAQFWINMQVHYDMQQALATPDFQVGLHKIKPIVEAGKPIQSTDNM
ncbi:HigA family addiction module antidote protein [Labrenzia sp. R4_1]|uniref:HigA family addiction module antitoxin n=1 Tax=Labrenzia sp. R4_1 TaxID=2821106 RepID=UPI001AD9DE43|nr:HigA family addiction module antitoxin [Labrenzia sp. R4_1]MBO9427780.1 HigA family addiction module antidote protein [Labrenzia sp. R4_1]